MTVDNTTGLPEVPENYEWVIYESEETYSSITRIKPLYLRLQEIITTEYEGYTRRDGWFGQFLPEKRTTKSWTRVGRTWTEPLTPIEPKVSFENNEDALLEAGKRGPLWSVVGGYGTKYGLRNNEVSPETVLKAAEKLIAKKAEEDSLSVLVEDRNRLLGTYPPKNLRNL